jgi:MFS family permease
MALYTLVFLTPFYLMFILHYSILKVGLVMAASPVVTLIVAPLSGTASDRIGTRVFAVCGMGITALGLSLFSGLRESVTAFDVAWRLAVTGLGMGMFQSPNNSTVMGNVPPRQLGIASGILAAMRNVGMVLGIAVAGAILYSLAPITASANPDSFSPTDVNEFIYGLRWSYISGAALAATAALTSLLAIGHRPEALEPELPHKSQKD